MKRGLLKILVLPLFAGCTQVDPEVVDKLSQRTHWLKEKIQLLEEETKQTKLKLDRLQTRYIDLDTRYRRLDLEFKMIQNKVQPIKDIGDRQKIEEEMLDLVSRIPSASEEEWGRIKEQIVRLGSLVVPYLLQSYKDGNFTRAGDALREIKDPLALPALVSALEVSKTRLIAAETIEKLGLKEAIEHLAPYLDSEDPSVRVQIATSLAVLGDMSGMPALIEELDHPEYDRRFLANSRLTHFTKTDMGFNAEQNKDQRKPAIAKWKSWWRQNKDRFKLAFDWSKRKGTPKPGEGEPGEGEGEEGGGEGQDKPGEGEGGGKDPGGNGGKKEPGKNGGEGEDGGD